MKDSPRDRGLQKGFSVKKPNGFNIRQQRPAGAGDWESTDKRYEADASLIAYAPELYSIALEQQKEIERLKKLIPDGFKIWLRNHGWTLHSSGHYYYKTNCQWPPLQNEMANYSDLLNQFKADNQL